MSRPRTFSWSASYAISTRTGSTSPPANATVSFESTASPISLLGGRARGSTVECSSPGIPMIDGVLCLWRSTLPKRVAGYR